ncbi:MAG: thioredoxin [Paraprevotella sp.]|nr:thioredoxin [Paraprevotella sp.]
MEKETYKQLINSPGLVLVDFYATWCGPCQRMHPILQQLKAEMGDTIRIAKIDVDANELLAASYNIQSVPTMMLFKDGQLKWRASGGMSLSQLQERLAVDA